MSIFGPPDTSKLENARDVKGLIKALRHRDTATRRSAARALLRLRQPQAIDPLCAALEDADSQVRGTAACALMRLVESAGETRGEIAGRASAPLARALGDPDREVRRCAAMALGVLGDRRSLDTLLEELKALAEDTDAWLARREIAESLENVPDQRALEPLLAELGTKNICSPVALARIGGDRVRRALMGVLENNRIFVGSEIDFRYAAVRALTLLGDRSVIGPMLDALSLQCNQEYGGANMGAYVVDALLKIVGADDIGTLAARLGHSDLSVRFAAARLLGALGDSRAIGPLVKAWKETNQTPHQRPIRVALTEAIAAMKDKDAPAIEALTSALQDEWWSVRKAAAEALKARGEGMTQ